jgi:hypothetical protein
VPARDAAAGGSSSRMNTTTDFFDEQIKSLSLSFLLPVSAYTPVPVVRVTVTAARMRG